MDAPVDDITYVVRLSIPRAIWYSLHRLLHGWRYGDWWPKVQWRR
jgi:hypothetical protein